MGGNLGLALIFLGCGLASAAGTMFGIRGWNCDTRRYAVLARIGATLNALTLLGTVLFFIALHLLAENFRLW
jgi:hypothetical protein